MDGFEVISLQQSFFEDFGYSLNPSSFIFEKVNSIGKQVIFIHYQEYPDTSYLDYKLGVRIDQVEEIIHRFLPTLSDYAERSITLIQTPDKIGKEIPKRFVLSNNSQLAKAIMAAEKFFVSYGFHWLDQMIKPQILEKEFAQRKQHEFRTQNFVYYAFRGVTLARLYNPDDYPILREIYLSEINHREMTPFTIASFLQLLDFLDHLEIKISS